ncbi:Bug family tripartite tricarboxylate transporter substrate binding protein [Curvibacter delicatus]|jgi:tripartite-type tricarboxylate transporter receptor subunit TctC|uniref:Bug family tripartite tricarboxylate transporter substrate binding protein n=1 Tax=Curvibacter delicatus TaxID=80879 RepID=UPI0008340086|nr:tripartite tricarboxylate transporter substrate binding protein [Curvibacter delicatus]
MTLTRRSAFGRVFVATAIMLASWGAIPATAQDRWPTKPVRIVVPFAAGGSTDAIARMVGQKLAVLWGQPVVIENRAGAGGNLGADAVAKSKADGYTLLMASGSITINPYIYKSMPFDTKKDLVPITNVASGPMLLVVPERSAVKSVKELIALAKTTPGAVTFGSAGVGSQVHLAAENFANAARIEINHVPYRGEAVAYNDLIAGQIHMMVGNFAAASALLGSGRLRALAVTGKERSQQLPDVPTVSESGVPGFENSGWFGFFAPAGTPQDILSKIQSDTAKVLAESDTKARLYVQGMTPVGNTSAEFAKAMDAESKLWAAVVKNRNITTN